MFSSNLHPKHIGPEIPRYLLGVARQASLRILQILPITSIPNVPVSLPFVERLIGTIRREYLDHLFYWNSRDLEAKLEEFRTYFNGSRVQQGIDGDIPNDEAGSQESTQASLENIHGKRIAAGFLRCRSQHN